MSPSNGFTWYLLMVVFHFSVPSLFSHTTYAADDQLFMPLPSPPSTENPMPPSFMQIILRMPKNSTLYAPLLIRLLYSLMNSADANFSSATLLVLILKA